ncbi:MAG: thiolase [Burkholderiales bacterium]|jgi:acetyl-CoA acetyltransferase|uniref:acetyl-CoA acetyltransferase n=1 Tax=Ottowia sp. VDI28 TaxID=3133968 RepID=UPI0009285F0C|nr:thiolase [Burkholderiales bacterium]OJX34234.1 MAG: thiolase [Burkholderiales bacterium 68-12]
MKKREAVIVGVADLPLKDGKALTPMSVLQAQALVARDALKDADIAMNEVDGLLTTGMWGVPGPGQLPTVTLSEYLGITPRFVDGTNIGGSAFEAHVAHAATAIEAGRCEVALITYGSLQRSEMSRNLAGRPSVLTMQYETPWGMPTPVGGYAMAAMRHMHEYGTTSGQLAEIAVATRKWAQLNPAATMRDPLSIDDVLESPMISDPLHLLDACLVTDGGGAVVMTTAEHAKALGRKPVYVRGYGESHTHWTIAAMPDLARLTAAEVASRDAFAMAGIGHDAIDVVEVYDSFTITVLLTLEALGFCQRGEGGAFVSNQRTAPGGAFPLNTNGGGLSYAHPGMYGIFLLIEAVRQLRGECGPRQIQDAVTALVHGTGGTLSSGATCILSTQ